MVWRILPGLDSVAHDLKAQGIQAKVAGHLHWSAEVAEILRERSAGQTGPLILVGHSQGEQRDRYGSLPCAISHHRRPPGDAHTVSCRTRFSQRRKGDQLLQFFRVGQPIAADSGFSGKIVNIDLANDFTINHTNVDKSVQVRAEIVREINALNGTAIIIAPTITAGRTPTARY